jgi:hypothetical protein
MGPQPRRQDLGLASFQQIDRLVGLHIDQQRRVVPPAPQGQIIHAQDTGRRQVRYWLAAHQAQEREPAGRGALPLGQPRSGAPPDRLGQLAQVPPHIGGEARPTC